MEWWTRQYYYGKARSWSLSGVYVSLVLNAEPGYRMSTRWDNTAHPTLKVTRIGDIPFA